MSKVVVSVDKLRSGLADEGKIALYGIYLPHGPRRDSARVEGALSEMASLLGADRSLKVSIVGHTEGQGAVDANLLLSQRRAEAVVAVLVTTYHIDASRPRALGVANFSPVSTNHTEAGRARNRRVELVEQ